MVLFGFFIFFFYLLLSDSPVCAASAVTIVGASLEESISVPCRINADPPDVEFEWSFSSSGERFEVPHGHYTTVQDTGNKPIGGSNNGGGMDGTRISSALESSEMHGESDGRNRMFT